ncbi:hypothetical protein EDB80DRAFT_718305 [Ilyonectria destructans]|nr:hypothetical protein EDB80DRAFT_718305 [Ilyonectria destructans]
MILGDNLQPAALIQIYEAAICEDYYKTHSIPSTSPQGHDCQIQPVQKELALVLGFQQLGPLVPGLLCTVPPFLGLWLYATGDPLRSAGFCSGAPFSSSAAARPSPLAWCMSWLPTLLTALNVPRSSYISTRCFRASLGLQSARR